MTYLRASRLGLSPSVEMYIPLFGVPGTGRRYPFALVMFHCLTVGVDKVLSLNGSMNIMNTKSRSSMSIIC